MSWLRRNSLWRGLLVIWGGVMLAQLACQAVSIGGSNELLETRVALVVQQTHLARTVAVLTSAARPVESTEMVPPLPATETFSIPSTLAVETQPILPLATPQPVLADLDRRLRAAKVLVFENMSASGYERYVLEALDQDEYFYIDVGSAAGWFKAQMLSDVDWDLVIAAVEAQRDFGGDLYQLLDQQAEKGAAVILETWTLDDAPTGMSDLLLSRCGVEFDNDWYEPDLRVFYWLKPGHPMFQEPNHVPNLRNAARLWQGDIGDLLRIRYNNGAPVGDAVILASTNPALVDEHAVLLTCLGGRVIIQTFRSHEYQPGGMLRLWQNYIYQALKARLAELPSTAPTPAVAPAVSPTSRPDGEELSEPGVEFPCGEAFLASLTDAPRFQLDLFEHHAKGKFLIAGVQLVNLMAVPIQVWDGDYFVEGLVNGSKVSILPHRAATGYLFINGGVRLYQDLLKPGEIWRTALAFDVNEAGSGWELVIRPGYEMKEQICEVRIPLTQ